MTIESKPTLIDHRLTMRSDALTIDHGERAPDLTPATHPAPSKGHSST
ncbi:hypothetical protein [Leucobacter aridicollis]|uniref:Uncharacterized protein n=1 Tax=Leucobacter aridicollis TaxID=283878 RepID=A0A852R1R5_9MICO|nr:hypothetical protein [Leucobacter aridicollis]NYD27541.1 hypothetical protein [Leucobacter aridicollis]